MLPTSRPRWSPDGIRILFFDASSVGNEKAYIVSSQGGNPKRLLPEDSGRNGSELVAGRDQNRLLY